MVNVLNQSSQEIKWKKYVNFKRIPQFEVHSNCSSHRKCFHLYKSKHSTVDFNLIFALNFGFSFMQNTCYAVVTSERKKKYFLRWTVYSPKRRKKNWEKKKRQIEFFWFVGFWYRRKQMTFNGKLKAQSCHYI